jgi:hypothetical protein
VGMIFSLLGSQSVSQGCGVSKKSCETLLMQVSRERKVNFLSLNLGLVENPRLI